jgi:glycosyltransferase involved in cell wall biosynthesis
MMAAHTDVTVSIIVPVRNAGTDVEGLLTALAAQSFPSERFEVIFGDDGSTDGSLATVTSGPVRARVVTCSPKNAYSARNRAVAEARGSVLAFCDADCRPAPGWLAAGIAELDRADIVAGLIRLVIPDTTPLWALADLDTFLDQERSVRANAAVTANLFVRRELFEAVGGFDDALPGHGDFAFVESCVAVGGRLGFSRNATLEHPARADGSQLLAKVREMHRSYAVRAALSGMRPDGLKLRNWVPVVQTARSRRRGGRPLGLDPRRLADSGVRPGLLRRLSVLPIIYLAIPYAGCIGQLEGWRSVRRAGRA